MAALNEIMKLVDAGFTKDEILAMTAEPEQTPAEQTPAEQTPAEQTPAEQTPAEQTPADQTPAEPKKPDQKSQLDILIEKVQELSNQVIANNINTQSMDGSQRRTDEDILAAVINPPRAEKKGK